MHADIERITQLAETVSSAQGLSIVEVRLAQQGKRRTIEVTIYRRGGRVSLTDCEHVSRELDAVLEVESPPLVEGAFDLEVQSPGIDRKLASEREYVLFSGQPVEVKTKSKVEGFGAAFTGKLVGLDNGKVVVANPEKVSDSAKPKRGAAKPPNKPPEAPRSTISVQMSNVISVRLLPQMPPAADDGSENKTK